MKRYFLAASLLIFGGLTTATSSARAVDFPSVNVPFAGVAAETCVVSPLTTPGLLTVQGTGSTSLSSEGNLPGMLTVICNKGFSVSTGTPVETTVLNPLNATTTPTSSIRETQTPAGAVDAIAGTDVAGLLPSLLYTITVDMIASQDVAVEAGAYSFDVPVTVTSD